MAHDPTTVGQPLFVTHKMTFPWSRLQFGQVRLIGTYKPPAGIDNRQSVPGNSDWSFLHAHPVFPAAEALEKKLTFPDR